MVCDTRGDLFRSDYHQYRHVSQEYTRDRVIPAPTTMIKELRLLPAARMPLHGKAVASERFPEASLLEHRCDETTHTKAGIVFCDNVSCDRTQQW